MKTTTIGMMGFMVVLALSSVTRAQSPNSEATLNQCVAELQSNPSDTALREKIIKLARGMNPPPAIPEEARRHYVKACTLFEDAKQPSDSADAAEEFRQALLVAPWWGEAYMKMGLALETAQRYDDAIASLKLFMATKPQDEMLRKTQDEIYKIEAKKEKAAKDQQEKAAKGAQAAQERRIEEQRAAVETKQQAYDAWLKKLDGVRFARDFGDQKYLYVIRGNHITCSYTYANDPYPRQRIP
jgi:tetratricopeptide (TPR) repeat protein